MLRPLGLGELIDRSLTFWRAHWKPLFTLVLGFQFVTFVIVSASTAMSRKLFPLANDPTALQKTPDLALPHLMGSMGVLMTASLMALYLSQVSGVATTWFTWSRITGRGTPGPLDSFRHAAARFGSTTGIFALSLAWSLVVMVITLLPAGALGGIAAALLTQEQRGLGLVAMVLAVLAAFLGLVVMLLWFVIRFILVSQIIAVETTGTLETFRRSNALSSGRVTSGFFGWVKVRLTVLVTVIGAILAIVTFVNSMPMLIAGAAYGATFNPGQTLNDMVPVYVLVPIQFGQTLLGAVITPILAVFQTWFFVDMKMRREGLDLELRLQGRA